MQQLVYLCPIFFRHPAGCSFGVANRHRLGAETRVLGRSFEGDSIELGCKLRKRTIQIAGPVSLELAINDSRFKFRRALNRYSCRVRDNHLSHSIVAGRHVSG